MTINTRLIAIGIIGIFLLSSIPMNNSAMPVKENEITAGEGTFRIAVQDDTWSLNPLALFDLCLWDPSDYIYDSAIRQNFTTKALTPYIAVGSANGSGDLSTINWDDCTVGNFGYNDMADWVDPAKPEIIVFYDFENVTWHDGVQMDIKDIMFSYGVAAQVPKWNSSVNCLKDNGGIGGNYTSTNWLHIYKVWENGNQAALKFVLQEPFYYFIESTLSVKLLPYHIWGCTVAEQPFDNMAIWSDAGYAPGNADAWDIDLARSWDNPNPTGSGLFEFDSWNHGMSFNFLTWRDHFYDENYLYSSEGKQPGIDAMIFKIYKTAEQSVLALRNNDIDYIFQNIPTPFVQEVANEPGLSIQMSTSPGFAYLGYNMGKESFGYDSAATFPYTPSDDLGKPLRNAIAHCIDKETMVRQLLQGYGGIEAHSPINAMSAWFNDTIPMYAFDPGEAENILNNNGWLDSDFDGWRDRPDGSDIGSGAGGTIEILTPPADYDPILAQVGLIIAAQLQAIGINAQAIAMDYGTTINRLEARDFDMYLLDMDIDSQPPEFFYDMFHSNMAEDGMNYFGYMNNSNDIFIDQARSTNDVSEAMDRIWDSQASIAYDLPLHPIYHRTIIEAYRSANFVGWEVDEYGTLFNMETLINLRKPGDKWIEAEFVAPPSAMSSNSTAVITVMTKDQDLALMQGVFVKLNCTSGSFSPSSGTTNAAAKLMVTFTAPYVPPTPQNMLNGVKVIIEIEEATLAGYDPALPKFLLITVYPGDQDFLSVSVVADPDNINDVEIGGSPGFTYFTVTVLDQDSLPVSGVLVTPSVSPSGPIISPSNGTTDVNGEIIFSFTSHDISFDAGFTYEFEVSVLVNMTGYYDETGSTIISITDRDKVVTPGLEISSVSMLNVKDTSATIKWLTNGPADSTVNYSINPDLSSNTSVTDLVNFTTNHVMTLISLIPGTTYYFEVTSKDFGAVATDNNGSNYYSFTTPLTNPVPTEGEWSDPDYISRDSFLWADTYGDDVMGYSPWGKAVFSSDLGDSWGQTYDFDGRVDLQGGVIYKANMSGDMLLFSKSLDDGDTWSLPVNIFQLDGSNDGAYGISMYESILFVYSNDQNMGSTSIKLSKSLDLGITWSAPIIVDSGLLTIDPLANEIVYANGNLYMSYFNMTGGTISSCQIIVIESSDMGQTWGNRQAIDTGAIYPVIKANNNTIYVSYITALDSAEFLEIELMSSSNGIDWSTPIKVGYIEDVDDPVILHSLAVDSGRVFVAYTDYHDLADDKYYVRINQSMDGGVTWQDMGDVTGLGTNTMYPCLAISGERLHFFWTDAGNGGWGGGDDNRLTLYRYFLLGEANITIDIPDPGPQPILSGMGPIVTDNSPTGSVVPSNSLITITFNKSMNQSSVEDALSISPSITVIYSWNVGNTILTITPSANLSQNTTYTVEINGMAKDLAGYTLDGNANGTSDGTPIDDHIWTFTTWIDTDEDGIPDTTDTDDDGDGVDDSADDFPLDPTEDTDADDDGIGDNADIDDDNDGTYDVDDDFPLDPDEDTDTDDDDIGNNADDDDDDDGYLDIWEIAMGTNPLVSSHSPLDTDNDGIPNGDLTNSESWMDTDDDGDDVLDADDHAPLNAEISDPPVGSDGANDHTWIFIILIIVIIGELLLLMRKQASAKTSSDTIEDTPETTDTISEPSEEPPHDPGAE